MLEEKKSDAGHLRSTGSTFIFSKLEEYGERSGNQNESLVVEEITILTVL